MSYQAAFILSERIYNRNKNIRPHIIYSLPFTSVIDQNYDVLMEIIKENTGKNAGKNAGKSGQRRFFDNPDR